MYGKPVPEYLEGGEIEIHTTTGHLALAQHCVTTCKSMLFQVPVYKDEKKGSTAHSG